MLQSNPARESRTVRRTAVCIGCYFETARPRLSSTYLPLRNTGSSFRLVDISTKRTYFIHSCTMLRLPALLRRLLEVPKDSERILS